MSESETPPGSARFSPGQLIQHELFDYRGVIVDVDATFGLTDEWYEQMARSRPPRDEPWYHVLVHDAEHMTYVAERNLRDDPSGAPVRHPQLELFFVGMRDGRYLPSESIN